MKKTTWSFILLFCITGCGGHLHNKEGVEMAMQHYDRLIQKMDADSIALLFTVDGDLGDIAHGRDSIRQFLASFKNIKVSAVSSSTDSLTLHDDTAFQTGHYRQSGMINGVDSFHVKGGFRAWWVWSGSDGWRIKKMTTQPEP